MDIKNRKILPILEKYRDDPEAIVITGFRRVGKTSILQHIYDNIDNQNKLFLDLESPVNQKLFQNNNYENIKQSLINLGLDFSQKSYIFLDEIQTTKTLPSVVKYLSDHNQIKFYLTGSSSFYLKNHFSESMSGRKYIFELFPLDFEEFLWFKDSKININADYDLLSGLYQEYLQYGGFPAVVLENSPEKKIQKIDDVLASYFTLDVTQLSNFRNNQKLKDLLFLLSSRVGNKLGIGKIAESLSVTRTTVYKYLDFFQQTYLIHLLKPLSGSRDIQIKSMPKLYFNDTGILNRIGQISTGQIFENKVFNQLYTYLKYQTRTSPLQDRISYFQLKTGTEIDFIVNEKLAYEVKQSGTLYDVKRLSKICKNLKITDFKVISLSKSTQPQNPHIVYPFNL